MAKFCVYRLKYNILSKQKSFEKKYVIEFPQVVYFSDKTIVMNQAEIGKLVSSLRFKVQPKLIKTNSGGDGPRGRLIVYRNSVTALINNERLDLIHNVLLSEAKREKKTR